MYLIFYEIIFLNGDDNYKIYLFCEMYHHYDITGSKKFFESIFCDMIS